MRIAIALSLLVALIVVPALAANPAGGPCLPPLGRLIKAADADHNGEVTWDEFHAKYPRISQDRFNMLDRNDDGVLSKADVPWEELPRVLSRLKHADTNADGSVTLEEFQVEFPNADVAAFYRLDRNDDNVINKDDCVTIAKK